MLEGAVGVFGWEERGWEQDEEAPKSTLRWRGMVGSFFDGIRGP